MSPPGTQRSDGFNAIAPAGVFGFLGTLHAAQQTQNPAQVVAVLIS